MSDFERFCALIGLELEPWQHAVVEEALSPRRELLVLIPRGCGKTTLMAALGLFRLLQDRRAAIVCAAASREQASHLFDKARGFALSNPQVRARLTVTRRDLRTATDGRLLVVSADAEKQLGWDPSLIFLDELCAHRDADLYTNLRTSLVKRPDAKMVTISTAGVGADSPLGQLRQRALALPKVERDGTFTRATGAGRDLMRGDGMEGFDFEAARKHWPEHWDERGRPARNSTWQSSNYPYMRVRVRETVDTERVEDGVELFPDEVRAFVYWEGSLDELREMFAYESDERWNLDRHGLVFGSGRIGRDRRWRDEGEELVVVFRREHFGGHDTWHLNFGGRTPPFEPVEDWDNSNPKEGTR